MKVYITYDRYEHNEWFKVYQITNNLEEVKRDYKDNLKSFIGYGPDDCHTYLIQVLDLSKRDYLTLKNIIENYSDSKRFDEIMTEIYENSYGDCLLNTDGQSDLFDMIDFGVSYTGLDEDEVREKLFNDDDFFEEISDQYIDYTYNIF